MLTQLLTLTTTHKFPSRHHVAAGEDEEDKGLVVPVVRAVLEAAGHQQALQGEPDIRIEFRPLVVF